MTRRARQGIAVGVGIALGWGTHACRARAQAEQHEAEFVMTKKAVEVLEYDARGVHTSSWTYPVAVLRHRATGACWLGQYQHDNALVWATAPSGLCK